MFNDLKRGKIYGHTYTQVMGILCLSIFFAFNIVKFKLVNKSAYICDRACFQFTAESNSRLHWLCLTTLCDCLREWREFCQPRRIKTKTNRDLLACVSHAFRRLRVFTSNCDWFVVLFAFPDWPE